MQVWHTSFPLLKLIYVFLPTLTIKYKNLALIKSISGIRGTIGGNPGENLTPVDVLKFTAAYGSIIADNRNDKSHNTKIVIGRDGRISGAMIRDLVVSTLTGLGIDIIDLGLSTTPTVEIAVKMENADGGIILTASHNTKEWNALKLLNHEGEFISAEMGAQVLDLASKENFSFSSVDKLGAVKTDNSYLKKHIDAILKYPLVNAKAIAGRNFKIVVDAINSTGATYVPALLKALGAEDVIVLNGEVNGKFAHNPEPLPQHLTGLSNEVVKHKADLGIAVDPDVDRLCFVCEDGSMFGEEYTLVAVADYVLSKKKGNTVSNMSSTKSLKEITVKNGGEYFPSAVGEVNVVKKMKEVNAVIGGEGNGGIIVPDFHYGRDALIGIGLFLSHLAEYKKGIKSLRSAYPDYFISKNKIELPAGSGGENGINLSSIFDKIKKKYKNHPVNTEDGLKIEFDNDWVHLRSSNTEPIIRIYSESNFETTANNIALRLMQDIREFM
jgi:phosphomannomutase